MPHLDFDALDSSLMPEVTCTILGTEYRNLRRLGMTLGARLRAALMSIPSATEAEIKKMTPEELDAYYLTEQQRQDENYAAVERAIDHCFGPGTYARWMEDDNFTTQYCSRVLQWMLDGFVDRRGDPKNVDEEETPETEIPSETSTSSTSGPSS